MRSTAFLAPWLALLLASPVAAAAAVAAQTWSATDATFEGALSLRAREATLDLSRAVALGMPVEISWTSARGSAYEEGGIRWATGGWTATREPADAPISWPAGTLSGLRCTGACDVLLVTADGEEDRLALEGMGAARVGPRTREAPLEVASASPAAAVRVAASLPRDALVASTPGGAPGATPEPVVEGQAYLLLWNVTGALSTEAGNKTLATGERREPLAGPVSPGERIDTRFVRVLLEGARVEAPGAPLALAAARVELVAEGVAESPRASGRVVVDGRPHELRDARLRVEGSLRGVASIAPALSGPAGSDGGRPRLAAEAEGDARSVRIDGVEVAPARNPAAGAAAATAGAAGLALLLALALRLGALTALYSRVTRGRVLQNENRRAVYEVVLAHPGAHVAQLVRETGVGKVVVRHHLRMLEAHRLIVARASGRVRSYYPMGAAPDADGVLAHVALKDPTRRRVLDAIAQSATGASQAELVERTGLSQRLVSYHVARLAQAGLVLGDGGRPQRFRAAAPAVERGAAS